MISMICIGISTLAFLAFAIFGFFAIFRGSAQGKTVKKGLRRLVAKHTMSVTVLAFAVFIVSGAAYLIQHIC